MEKGVESALGQSGPGADLGLAELELHFRQEEFVEIDGDDDTVEKKLIETKVAANHYCVQDF